MYIISCSCEIVANIDLSQYMISLPKNLRVIRTKISHSQRRTDNQDKTN